MEPAAILFLVLAISCQADNLNDYSWLDKNPETSLESRITPPTGFSRMPQSETKFAAWLRGMPLLAGNPNVHLFDGSLKGNQRAQAAVLDLDVGSRDLQQCADAVIRLRAEFLWARKRDISFNFTSGHPARWYDWQQGKRPKIQGNRVTWVQRADPDNSYASFRKYLNIVFAYAGTHSLQRQMEKVADPTLVQGGDVFIQGGFPGHAVLVMDVAINAAGERMFLLAQSYMPAQQMHLLRNPGSDLSPWYPAKNEGTLKTPEWTFQYTDLRRFP